MGAEKKSLLIVSRSAPWAGAGAREALDMALACAAFDLPVALLFLDDGLFQLLPGQEAGALEQKDLAANLRALPLFGIETCYGSTRALAERALDKSRFELPIQWLDDVQIGELFARFDHIITL